MERRGFLKGMIVAIGGILSPPLASVQRLADEIGTVRFNESQTTLFSIYSGYGMPVYRADGDGIVREYKS